MSPANDVRVDVRLTHDQLTAAGAGAGTLTHRPEPAVKPGNRALPGIETVAALPQSVTLARVDDEFGRCPLSLKECGVKFLGLTERRAAILAAVNDQNDGAWVCRAGTEASDRWQSCGSDPC